MSARHDHLHEALTVLLDSIERKDANGAEAAMERALNLFASTPAPGDDERLRPLMTSCEVAGRAFFSQLDLAVREPGTSARATHAYATGGQGEEP